MLLTRNPQLRLGSRLARGLAGMLANHRPPRVSRPVAQGRERVIGHAGRSIALQHDRSR